MADLPRKRLALGNTRHGCTPEREGTARALSRAPGRLRSRPFSPAYRSDRLVGEWRFGPRNDLASAHARFAEVIVALRSPCPADAAPPENWPLPELKVPRRSRGFRTVGLADTDGRQALAPGAVGPRALAGARRGTRAAPDPSGANVWCSAPRGGAARAHYQGRRAGCADLTGTDLRNAILGARGSECRVP